VRDERRRIDAGMHGGTLRADGDAHSIMAGVAAALR
jgi:hypothetical protein